MRDRKLTQYERVVYAAFLGDCEPFSALDGPVLRLLAENMRLRTFRTGRALLRQGDAGDCLMVLVEGEAEVTVVLPGGDATRVATVKEGDVVGEMALLSGEPRNADVVALGPTRVLVLSAVDFERIASKHLEITPLLTALLETRLTKKRLGGHRIERLLGKGAMGVVYEAVEETSGAPRALKMMSHRFVYDAEALRRFHREAETAASLDSDHVVRVFGRFASHKTYFLVMELCDGPSLADVIAASAPLEEDHVRAVVGQLAAGLGHIHDRGHLHRDVKPSNALLTRAGVAKLADLGLARPVAGSTITASGVIVGSPAYMSPENLAGAPIGTQSDVYALGCVAYELLTGHCLFPEGNLPSLLAKKVDFAVPAPEAIRPGMSQDLHAFLRASLQVDPQKRSVRLSEVARWARPLDAALVGRWAAARSPAPTASESAATDELLSY
jgi:CRP-like cAMP-binding protein